MDGIRQIRSDFDDLKETRQTIQMLFSSLSQKINGLQTMYVEFVNRGTDTDNNFGIDSLHFQRRYLLEEHNGMKKMFSMINNQMYRDFYKLFRVIEKYVKTNIIDKKVRDSCSPKREYTIYKDLEPYKEYESEELLDLHHDITHIIGELFTYTSTREKQWRSDAGKADHGLNIDNYVTTEKFENQLIEHKANMFLEYLQVFQKFHVRYLSRFSMKLRLMYSQVQKDIKFEEANVLARTKSDTGLMSNDLPSKLKGLKTEDELGEDQLFVKSPEIQKEMAEILNEMSHTSTGAVSASSSTQGDVPGVLESDADISSQTSSPNLNPNMRLEVTEITKQSPTIEAQAATNELTEQQKIWQQHNIERQARRRQNGQGTPTSSVGSVDQTESE